jgi:ribonuclease P protein component
LLTLEVHVKFRAKAGLFYPDPSNAARSGALQFGDAETAGASRDNDLINKDETYLSAQQSAAKADSRVPRSDGVTQWTSRAQTASHQGSSPPDGFDPSQTARVECRPGARFGAEYRLRRRTDFLRVRRAGLRFQSTHFVIYLAMLPDQPTARLGLAVSRELGNAVVRNRIKRRLRESFRCCLRPTLGPGSSVMIVARKGAGRLRTPEVTAELKPVLLRMAKKLGGGSSQDR